ncbi:flocculation-associated PEP-CTERM protein PepA [Massilia sp. CMS3.1]|uniref:flocculation-associated PEP-CTERM protein PepA n=1 Tax=Massilia sp. CMS3.1 TaxID=3373083 RepID=UPI003EE7A260
MNFLKKLGCAAAVALAAGTIQAAPVMNNWTFNPIGGGLAAGQTIKESLDVNGTGFIQIKPTGATSFSFTEYAAFNIAQADANGKLFPVNYRGGNIYATLEAFGTGTFNGAFTFSGGTIRMYQDPINNRYAGTDGMFGADLGTLIGTFGVQAGGGGLVDANGSPTNNGQVSIHAQAQAGALKAGYFFTDGGVDMSTVDMTAFAFTNANTIGAPGANAIKELACQFAGFSGPGCAPKSRYANVPGKYFFVGNSGQFKFADVPEPGSVALFGIALFGIGALRRRVK